MPVRMLIADLSDSELLSQIQGVVGSRNRATAQLLEYLGEVEARKLHIKEAYASIYDFCLRKLGFSEGSAVRHIAAARAGRRFPVALEFVRDGRVHLTGLALLKPQLTDDNHLELLTAAAGRSKAEIELLLRTRRPRPDVPESIRPVFAFAAARDACVRGAAGAGLGDRARAVGARGAGARGAEGPGAGGACVSAHGAGASSAHGATTGSAAANMTHAERGRVAPLSAERFHVEFTITVETKDKLERVLDLMSHANPRRSLATAFDRALDVLLRDLEKKRLGKTSHPRKSRGVKHGNIGRSTLREVYERDGVQCAFVSEAGVRCTSRVFLQTDHVIARALGGSGDAHNARVLCQPHNLFEAEETFGAEYVARKIEQRRTRARSCRVGARARGGEIDDSGNRLRQERSGNGSEGASCANRDAGSFQAEGLLTQATSDESGSHRRQDRLGTPSVSASCASGAGSFQPESSLTPEGSLTQATSDESGNHLRQESLCTGSVGASCASRAVGAFQPDSSLTSNESGNHRRQDRLDDTTQFECTTTKVTSDERGSHRRQERLDNEGRASHDAGSVQSEDSLAQGTFDETGNHRRQERLGNGSVDPQRALRGDDSNCNDDGSSRSAKCEIRAVERAPQDTNAAEVRGKLFAALTTMGFRRGETRNAIGRLEQRSGLGRAPIDVLLREALALLTR